MERPAASLSRPRQSLLILESLRPKQWTKNLLVFAALLFSVRLATPQMAFRSIAGFFLFSAIAGVVYILNDIVDRRQDQLHPQKRLRPIARGDLDPQVALVSGTGILALSLSLALWLDLQFGFILMTYFVINIGYSSGLKNIPILDVMIIASGFVFRALGGGLIIGLPFTPWFLLCTMLLALFLAISKRRQELYLNLLHGGDLRRKALQGYSVELLDQMNSIVISATIMSYALYTFARSIYLMWTLPFVIYGVFRYLYLIHQEDLGEHPERVLLEDRPILLTVILYALSVVMILFLFD